MGFDLYFLDPSYLDSASSPCLPISCLAEATTVAALPGMLSALAWPGLPCLAVLSLQRPPGLFSARVPLNPSALLLGNSAARAGAALQRLCPGPPWPGRGVASTEKGAAACRWWPVSGKSGQGSPDRTRASRYVCGRDIPGAPGAPPFYPRLAQQEGRKPRKSQQQGFLLS